MARLHARGEAPLSSAAVNVTVAAGRPAAASCVLIFDWLSDYTAR
jgi:hypothetical protein